MKFLLNELTGKRPLTPPSLQVSAEQADVINTFRVLAHLPADSLGAYVISMARSASDVLAVVLLQVSPLPRCHTTCLHPPLPTMSRPRQRLPFSQSAYGCCCGAVVAQVPLLPSCPPHASLASCCHSSSTPQPAPFTPVQTCSWRWRNAGQPWS